MSEWKLEIRNLPLAKFSYVRSLAMKSLPRELDQIRLGPVGMYTGCIQDLC